MTDLISRLESAEEGSRELDAEIATRLHFPYYEYPKAVLNRKPSSWSEAYGRLTHDGFGGGATAPKFTRSLDAALTLVPEGWDWELEWDDTAEALYWKRGIATAKLGDPMLRLESEAATPPLAMSAAGLKAREIEK